jgi:hypothetical protein
MGGLFVLIGVPVFLVGLATLLRPSWARALLGMPDTEAATYALRIGGMMVTALGLILASFSIAYQLSAPADLNSQGAM